MSAVTYCFFFLIGGKDYTEKQKKIAVIIVYLLLCLPVLSLMSSIFRERLHTLMNNLQRLEINFQFLRMHI